jgi:hypothetical protein
MTEAYPEPHVTSISQRPMYSAAEYVELAASQLEKQASKTVSTRQARKLQQVADALDNLALLLDEVA